ncbi:hypothetical protein BJX64DRAFT_294368 [Aspergillus heterothallicus]
MPATRSTRGRGQARKNTNTDTTTTSTAQPQTQDQPQAESSTQRAPTTTSTPAKQRKKPGPKVTNPELAEERRVRKERAQERVPLREGEMEAFQGAMDSYQGLLADIARRNNEPAPDLRWAYYVGENDEHVDDAGNTVPAEFDSDGSERLAPRERPYLHLANNYGPGHGLVQDVLAGHEAAVQETTGETITGACNERRVEMDAATVMGALPKGAERDQVKIEAKLPLINFPCDRDGWACKKCVSTNLDCTWTHRTNGYTLHLAWKDKMAHKIGQTTIDRANGFVRRDIRRATKMMIAGQDKLRELEARCITLQGALDARNDEQLRAVVQETAQRSQEAVAQARQDLERRDREVENLHIQLENTGIQSRDEEIQALRIENQRLANELENLREQAHVRLARNGKRIEVRHRNDPGRETWRQNAKARKEAALAAARAVPSALPQAQQASSDEGSQGYSHSSDEPEYNGAPGRIATPELMSMEDINQLRAATYADDEFQQAPVEQQPVQQSSNNPYGNIDPRLFGENAAPEALHEIYDGADLGQTSALNVGMDEQQPSNNPYGALDPRLFAENAAPGALREIYEGADADQTLAPSAELDEQMKVQRFQDAANARANARQAERSARLQAARQSVMHQGKRVQERPPPEVAREALARQIQRVRRRPATDAELNMDDPEIAERAYNAAESEESRAKGKKRSEEEQARLAQYGDQDPLDFEGNEEEAAIENEYQKYLANRSPMPNSYSEDVESILPGVSSGLPPPPPANRADEQSSADDELFVPQDSSDPNLPSSVMGGASGQWEGGLTDDINVLYPDAGNVNLDDPDFDQGIQDYFTRPSPEREPNLDADGDAEMMDG